MEKINISIKNKDIDYNIIINNSIFVKIKEFLISRHKDKKTVIITDDYVNNLYGKPILRILGFMNPVVISVNPGENSKSRKTKNLIEDRMLENRCGRDTVIIALGGGVIGDLAGFVASTFNRGIPYIQVPTTLLAMVDSSIGGKTSIDTEHGKNLIGTFWHPDAVFIDLDFLDTLPDEELLNGLAEVVKIAIASDKEFFSILENNRQKISVKDRNFLSKIVKRSIQLKKKIVEKDERETGLRQILNFGHTFGHALEAYSGYKIKHGNCISLGMTVESRIAVLSGNLDREKEKRIVSLLEFIGLPTELKKDIQADKIINFMESDKKTRDLNPRFVILEDIGKIKTDNENYSFEVSEDIIKKAIKQCQR